MDFESFGYVRRSLLLCGFIASLLTGCVSRDVRAMDSLRARAAFELGCPTDQTQLTVLERYKDRHPIVIGAQGCGLKAEYHRDLYAKARPWFRAQ